MTIASIGANLLRVFSTVVLTRLLTPATFGQTAIVASVFFIIGMLTDVGFQAFVVRHARGDERYFLDVVWTMHAARGLINFMIVALLAWPVSMLLDKPEISGVLLAMSVTLLIDGLVSIRVLSAVGNGLIARLSAFELALSAFQIACSIAAAFVLRNVWALVVASIATSLLRLSASYFVFGRGLHKPRLDQVITKEMWMFSRAIASSSIITMIIAQVDKIVLARFLTLSQFGVYGIASNLSGSPQSLAYSYCNRVLYAAYASAERSMPGGAERFYLQKPRFFYVYLFLVANLIALAPVIVRVLYDFRYQNAAIYISILAIASCMLMMTQAAVNFFVAAGRPGHVLRLNIARLCWLVVVAPTAFTIWGAMGLVATLGLIELPAYALALILSRSLGVLRWRAEALAWMAILAGLVVGGTVNFTLGEILDSVARHLV